jgi:hypothetical protein
MGRRSPRPGNSNATDRSVIVALFAQGLEVEAELRTDRPVDSTPTAAASAETSRAPNSSTPTSPQATEVSQ